MYQITPEGNVNDRTVTTDDPATKAPVMTVQIRLDPDAEKALDHWMGERGFSKKSESLTHMFWMVMTGAGLAPSGKQIRWEGPAQSWQAFDPTLGPRPVNRG